MIDIKEIHWLAGLLEGEGSFDCAPNGGSARILLAITDRDVVERAARILGYNGEIVEYQPKPGNKNYKTLHRIHFLGDAAIGWMMTIYPLMGNRRKEKIRSILTLWRYYGKGFTKIIRALEASGMTKEQAQLKLVEMFPERRKV